jgi:copper chaperone CopZ
MEVTMNRLQLCALTVLAMLAGAARAETIEMTVNGLVCAFCAQGIEKTLRKNAATEDVIVSLEHRLVAVATRPGTDIADAVLRAALTDAGYDVKEIVRTERSLAAIREQLKAER